MELWIACPDAQNHNNERNKILIILFQSQTVQRLKLGNAMKLFVLSLLLILPSFLLGQNLVPNPNFENLSACPQNFDDFGVNNWIVPTSATTDYHHECGAPNVSVPANIFGFQASSTDMAYIGLITYDAGQGAPPNNYREYAQAVLDEPTIANACYELTIIYSVGDATGFSNGIGMLLSDGAPTSYIGQIPQMQKSTIQEDETIWHTLTTNYTSPGGETHITLGNFNDDDNTTHVPIGFLDNLAYYYIDSVSVQITGDPSPNVQVDIGEDIAICATAFPYTITSSNPNAYNAWSTGESGTSIEVQEAGTYYVQSYINCEYGTDSIEISILDDLEFEVNDTFLCEGSETIIELDSDLGEFSWDDGSDGNTFIITEAGTYSVTLDYACGTLEEEFEVDILQTIEIPEQNDLEICETDLPILIDYTAFDNGVNEFLWLDGSDAPGLIITGIGTYGVSIFNDCFSDEISFDVAISLEYPNTVEFNDTIACPGQEILIDPQILDVDYLWQDGSTGDTFLASGPGNYAVTVSNFCGSEVYNFEILPPSEIPLNLGEDIDLCPGDSVLISAPNDELINWNTGEISSEIWVKTAGPIIGQVEGQCSVISDTILVSFNGLAPEIDLPDSLLLCEGDSVILVATTENTAGIDFMWSTASQESEITITSEGIYSLTASNNCGSAMDSVVVILGESLADPDLDDNYMICSGDSISLEIETNGADISWSTGSQNPIVQIFDEGQYFVSLTNSCKTKIDSFEVSYLQELATFDLGPDLSLCEAETIEISAPLLDGNYVWNTGDETEMININTPGEYWLSIEGNCNTASDTINILDQGTIPFINLGPDLSFCQGDSVVLTVNDPVSDIIWNNGSMEQSITVSSAGTFIVFASNDCGTNSDTIITEINNIIPQIELGEDQVICQGDSFILDLTNITGNISWSTGEIGNSIEVLESGEYIASVSSSCGESSDTIQFEVLVEPESIGWDNIINLCAGETYDIELVVPSNTDIFWNSGSSEGNQSFTEEGLYWLEQSNECGVIRDSFEIEITLEIVPFNLPEDITICDESEYLISSGIVQENVDIVWNTSSNTGEILVDSDGIYSIEVSNECFLETDSIEVLFAIAPLSFDLGMDETICRGESVILEGFQGDNFDYAWQNNESNSSIIVTESGIYSLAVSSICGVVIDEIEITVIDSNQINVPLLDTYAECKEDSLIINLSGMIVDQVIWENGSQELIRVFSEPGNYQVQFLSNCIDTVYQFIFDQINCGPDILYIPNIFTPNNDGANDFFQVFIADNQEILNFQAAVYNRWGEKVFYSEDIDETWDGSFKNQGLNSGVYGYIVTVEVSIDGEIRSIQKTGDITIVK